MKPSINNTKYIIFILIGAFLISFSGVFVKLMENTGSITTGFYRMLFGGLVLLPLALYKREKLWAGWKSFVYALAAGFFFALDLTFWHYSIDYIGPGLATIIANFQVFFLAITGYLVFKEKIGWRLLLGIPLAMFGIFLLCGIRWNELSETYHLGVLFGFLTSVVYAGYILSLRQFQFLDQKLSVVPNMVWVCFSCCLILYIEVLLLGENFIVPPYPDIVYAVLYGFASQGLAWILISIALPYVRASLTGLILLLQPTCAMIWDILFFNRPTTQLDLIGAALAILAIYLGSTSRKTVEEN
jgi:drug/metabolite transporter (DMT)-like permease